METHFTKHIEEILERIAQTIEKSKKLRNGSPEEIIKRTKLQAGMTSELGINYFHIPNSTETEKLKISISDIDEKCEIEAIKGLNNENFNTIFLPLFIDKLKDFLVRYNEDPVLDYKITVQFKYPEKLGVPINDNYILFTHISESKKNYLLKNVEEFIDSKIINGKYPNKDLEITFLSGLLLDKYLYEKFDAKRIIYVIERIFVLNKQTTEMLKHHRNSIIYNLKEWAENDFLAKYYYREDDGWGSSFFSLTPSLTITTKKENVRFDTEDEALIELLVYTAILILKYEPNYARSTGLDYLRYVSELGFEQGKEILKTGSGSFDKADIIYKDKTLEIVANDVMATFSIKMKEESELNYTKALDFIINLLEKNFPASYQIKLSSKVKNYLPIPKIGKSKTHQFFANAMQYPQLWNKMEKYVRVAIKEFEWYGDIEDEQCAMPGTYATFGLALADKKYFPLLDYYIRVTDEEHQSVQHHFAKEFIKKWGISTETIPLIVKCILCINGVEKAKMGEYFSDEQTMKVLIDHVENFDDWNISTIIYFIWGTTTDLQKVIKLADEKVKPYLEKILNKVS